MDIAQKQLSPGDTDGWTRKENEKEFCEISRRTSPLVQSLLCLFQCPEEDEVDEEEDVQEDEDEKGLTIIWWSIYIP